MASGAPKIALFIRRRDEAVRAIEIAIAILEGKPATNEQLGDLADAIDALKQEQFYVSVLLAHGAAHSKPLEGKRPATLSRTFEEMRREFERLRGHTKV